MSTPLPPSYVMTRGGGGGGERESLTNDFNSRTAYSSHYVRVYEEKF